MEDKKTHTFTLYGASDDLIELEGAVDDELSAYNAGDCLIEIDGIPVATIAFESGGLWRITPQADTGPVTVVVTHEAVDDDLRDHPGTAFTRYSDVAVITGPMGQVRVAGQTFELG